MNNQLLAKVLFTNGLATREQIQQYWALASDSKDIALVLREQGLMTPEVYNQVMTFVASMDGIQAPNQTAPQPVPTTPQPIRPAPVAPVVQAVPSPPRSETPSSQAPSDSRTDSRPFGLGKAGLDRPSIRPSSSTLAEVVAASATTDSEQAGTEFSLEGNNPYGEGFEEESAEEVRTIEGLQDTRIFDFRPSAQASVAATPSVMAEEQELLQSTSSTLPPKDWHCSVGGGEPRTSPTLVPGPQAKLEALLLYARKQRLSDLYLTVGAPIWGRGQRVMRALCEQACSQADVRRWLTEALDQVPNGLGLDRTKNLRVALAYPGAGRFRLVITWTLEGPALAFHLVPLQLPSWQDLGLPDLCRSWLELRKGLILVGGTSGSGCSTTVRRFAESAQEQRACLVQVIAEPIESLWEHGMTLHFEPGLHGLSKSQLIREAMRRGDGVLVVEDSSEPEQLLLLLEAAENGMLVIAFIESLDIVDLLTRFIAKFPSAQSSMVRSLLVRSLHGIIWQTLFASVQGDRCHAAFEALTVSPAIASHIRAGELGQIRSLMPSLKGQALSFADSVRKLSEMNLIRKGDV